MQIGVYKILVKEISFYTGFDVVDVAKMMDRFENEYNMIKYNKDTHEVAIVHWAKYNLNKLGGKPILDCILSELKKVEDVCLLKIILEDITREEIRKIFIKEIEKRENKVTSNDKSENKENKATSNNKSETNREKSGEVRKHEFGAYSKIKFASSIETENDQFYEKPSEEQLRKVRELYS